MVYAVLLSKQLLSSVDNPAANPKDGSLEVVVGDTVSIQFYTSGLSFENSYPDADAINWTHNNKMLDHGTLMKDNRILEIDNVQESHAGAYKFIVTDLKKQSATAITVLNVKKSKTLFLYNKLHH